MISNTQKNIFNKILVALLFILAIIQLIIWINIFNYQFYVENLYSKALHNPLMLLDAVIFMLVILLSILWSIRIIKLDKKILWFMFILVLSHLILGYLEIRHGA
jgi:hypothetical protein